MFFTKELILKMHIQMVSLFLDLYFSGTFKNWNSGYHVFVLENYLIKLDNCCRIGQSY